VCGGGGAVIGDRQVLREPDVENFVLARGTYWGGWLGQMVEKSGKGIERE